MLLPLGKLEDRLAITLTFDVEDCDDLIVTSDNFVLDEANEGDVTLILLLNDEVLMFFLELLDSLLL